MNTIIIPVDFSETSVFAIHNGIFLAERLSAKIKLLHVIPSEDQKNMAIDRLDAMIFRLDSPSTLIEKEVVIHEDLFEVIKDQTETHKPILMVMGTSGLKGFEYIFGSRALKMVTSGTVPFVITQKRIFEESIKDIVVPINLASEDKQILSLVVRLSQLFKARVHLFLAKHSDHYLNDEVKKNELFAKRYLGHYQLDYSITHADGSNDFDTELIQFADLIDADLIAMVNHEKEGFLNLLGANFDQNVITNKSNIPVIIMNAFHATYINDLFQVFI